MRILLTNAALDHRAGTELVVFDLARAFRARGHSPIAYSTQLGHVAAELRRSDIPVVDDLRLLREAPDVIHGHHQVEAMTAMLRFPTTPAIYVCHGFASTEERPPRFPTIGRYVAVDELTRRRVVRECGIAPDAVRMIPNFVDLDRFLPRAALPLLPRRALVFSNRASDSTFVPPIRAACREAGIDLEVAGLDWGRVVERPADLLLGYDLVFAKARCALEAMAVGAAVILCDEPGLGPLVQSTEFDRLRAQNFGLQALSRPVSAEAVVEEIRRYDRLDAAKVTARVRGEAGLDHAADRYLALYEEVRTGVELSLVNATREACGAAADYLRERGRAIYDAPYLVGLVEQARSEFALASPEAEANRQRSFEAFTEVEWMRQTMAWRLREWLLRRPFCLAAYRFLRRSAASEQARSRPTSDPAEEE